VRRVSGTQRAEEACRGSVHFKFVQSSQSPDDLESEIAAVPYNPSPASSSGVAAVKDRNESRLLAIDGVEGVGIGQNQSGDDAILVFIRDSSVVPRLPTQIEGVPVVTVVTGEIRPL
jgi:hypothetical protein